MPTHYRKRRTLHLPIGMSVVLGLANITLMVLWIVLIGMDYIPGALVIGIIAFAVSLFGISFYLFLTIKEIRLNRRQANFVDSVTHELKTPIASLRLYLETLQMREIDRDQQEEFYSVMETELKRLDRLINQLLEVGRLDAVGHQSDPEDVSLEPLLRRCAEAACAHYKLHVDDVFTFDMESAIINSRRMLLEMIFGNLLDNAVKYSGTGPEVTVRVRTKDRGRVAVSVIDNGDGIPLEMQNKIFRMFYRGGDELQRKQKGTGLGLYIVRTLVTMMHGTIEVRNRNDASGSEFHVELPGRRAEPHEVQTDGDGESIDRNLLTERQPATAAAQ